MGMASGQGPTIELKEAILPRGSDDLGANPVPANSEGVILGITYPSLSFLDWKMG